MDNDAKKKLLIQISAIYKRMIEIIGIIKAKKGINGIIIHHTAGNLYDTVEAVDIQGVLDGYPLSSLGHTMAYHYLITADGAIIQGREDTEYSEHARGMSKGMVGICLTGNFMNYNITPSQSVALSSLIDRLKLLYHIENKEIKPHYYYNNTLCPGKFLIEWLKKDY